MEVAVAKGSSLRDSQTFCFKFREESGKLVSGGGEGSIWQ